MVTRASKKNLNVSAAQAKAHFGELLRAIERGETVTIERYNKPFAKLVPANIPGKRPSLVGFFDGVITVLDPNWAKKPTLTDEEIDQLSEANY